MEDVWKKFEANEITHSAAHHLMAILELKKEYGYARVTDVARELHITSGSASTNLKSLKAKGLVIEDNNRFLQLSEEGDILARLIMKRKEILLEFFTKVLGVSNNQAEIDACKTEHLISMETTRKLEKFVQTHQK